jgi:hypothetical protein
MKMPEIDLNKESLQDVMEFNKEVLKNIADMIGKIDNSNVRFYIMKGGHVTECIPPLNPAALTAWSETANKCIKTRIVGDVTIKTIFIGFDASSQKEGSPVLFSTMALGENISKYRLFGDNYFGALIEHSCMVEWVKKSLGII